MCIQIITPPLHSCNYVRMRANANDGKKIYIGPIVFYRKKKKKSYHQFAPTRFNTGHELFDFPTVRGSRFGPPKIIMKKNRTDFVSV